MPRVVVLDGRDLPGADPARVWALVADPARAGEWTGLHAAGSMARELPTVGDAFYLTRRPESDPRRATRYQLVQWVAGRSYRCSMSSTRTASGRELEVRVHTDPLAVSTRVEIVLRADVNRWAAAPYRAVALTRIRGVLRRLATRIGET
ncbi:MAG: SRPBCC family protein [Acidimicrobiia bacterium]